MFIVRKFDRKLPAPHWIAKVEASGIAWRGFVMAVGTDRWLGALEELWAMTADAGVVIGKVGDVGKVADLFPISRGSLVTSLARFPMLPGCMGEA